MTQTTWQTRSVQTVPSGTIATKQPLSRKNPPKYKVGTPALLRYLQLAMLTVGLVVGCMAIPLMAAGQEFASEAQTEVQHAGLSAIQTEVAKANELALTSMLKGKPDREGFQKQMGTVATKVAVASQGATIDTDLLGQVNSGLVYYTAQVNTALTADQAKAGSGNAEMIAAQQTLNNQVLASLDKLLTNASTNTSSPLIGIVLGWVAISLGGITVLWASVLLARRTKRVANLGLAVALTILVAAGAMLTTVNGFVSAPTDAAPAHSLTSAEGTVARIRAAELTYLLDPTASSATTDVPKLLDQAKAQLQAGDAADLSLDDYAAAWQSVVTAASADKLPSAITVATTRSGPALAKITSGTDARIVSTRESVMKTLNDGAPAFNSVGAGMIAAGVGVAVSGMIGVQRRKREYR